jgi:hypothetical protein
MKTQDVNEIMATVMRQARRALTEHPELGDADELEKVMREAHPEWFPKNKEDPPKS